MSWFDNECATLFTISLIHYLWIAAIPWSIWSVFCRLNLDNANACYWASVACLLSLLLATPVALLISNNALSTGEVIATNRPLTLNTDNISTGMPEARSTAPSTESSGFHPTQHLAESGVALIQEVTIMETIRTAAPAVVCMYLLGVVVFSTRFLRAFIASRRLRLAARHINDSLLIQMATKCATCLKLAAIPTIKCCQELTVPMVAGIMRPIVLLPISWTANASPQQIQHVLMHEFVHLRRFDPLINGIQSAIETLLFFHPLVWHASRRTRLYREISCDMEVVRSGANPTEYANTLIDVAIVALEAQQPNISAVIPSTASITELRQRITKLALQQHPKNSPLCGPGWSIATLTTALLLAWFTWQPTKIDAEQPALTAPAIQAGMDLEDLSPDEFAGYVLDEAGKPIAGATVDAWHWHPGDETTTNRQGFFRFKPSRDNARDRVEIRISRPGYAPYYNHLQVIGQKDFQVTLNRKTYAQGVLRSPDGKPVADTEIVFKQGQKRADGVMISGVSSTTRSDKNGHYKIYLAPDQYTVQVQSSVGVTTVETSIADKQAVSLDLNLAPGVRFMAQVIDASTRKPLSGVALFRWRKPRVEAISNEQGQLVIEGLIAGKTEFSVGSGKPRVFNGIRAYQHGFMGRWWSPDATRSWQRHSIEDDQWQRNFDDLEFDLRTDMKPVKIYVERGVTFRGKVVDPDGNPVAGATVAPAKTGSGNSLTGDTRYSTKTRKDGTYEVIMPAGNRFEYNLVAHDGKYRQWRTWALGKSKPVKTKPGQVVKEFNLTLTRPTTIRGSIENPRPGLKVRAVAADKDDNRYYVPTSEVSEDGTFEIKFVPPGPTLVQVSPFWLSADQAPVGTTALVDVTEGEPVTGIVLTAAPE